MLRINDHEILFTLNIQLKLTLLNMFKLFSDLQIVL